MDKYEFNLKLDQIKSLCAENNYEAATEIADTINWNKVKNVNALVKVGEAYEKTGRYAESRDVLLLAYDRSPIGRMIIYRLAEVAIKMNDFEAAKEYYDEFVEIAPHDNLKYVLRYHIKKATGANFEELIPILEEFKEQEYMEEWAYELAYLYHKSGMVDKCIDACDELILWFGDGPYVERALELKMLYQPLTKAQEEKYRAFRLSKDGYTHIGEEEMKKAGEFVHAAVSIPPVAVNTAEKFSTVNLQEEIAKGMQQIIEATEKDEVADTMDNIKKIVEEIPYLQIPREEDKEKEDSVHIETDEEIDGSLRINFQEMIGEESDGQMSLVMNEKSMVEHQITGQMTISDILEEWEKTKRAAEAAMQEAEQRKLESAKARALQEAEGIMERLNDVIPKLDAGMKPIELLDEEYMSHVPEIEVISSEEIKESLEMQENPIEEMPIDELPVDEIPEEEIPVESLLVELEAVEDTEKTLPKFGIEEISIEENPIEEIPMEEIAMEEIAIEETDIEEKELEESASEEENTKQEDDMLELEHIDILGILEEAKKNQVEEEMASVEDVSAEEDSLEEIPEEEEKSFFGQTRRMPSRKELGLLKGRTGVLPQIPMPEDLDDFGEEKEVKKSVIKLTDEQKAVFTYFIPIKGMEDQLCKAISGISDRIKRNKPASAGNLIVQGGQGCGKTVLATSLIKVLQDETGALSGKVGKIDASALNTKDIPSLLRKVAGGCLIIERAEEISRKTAATLSLLLEHDTSGLLVILEGSSMGIKKALSVNEEFAKKFTEKIEVPIFSIDELVSFARAYSNELGYEIEEMAVLALYNRISNIQKLDQATTLTEVKEIVDEAIEREAKGGIRKAFSILTAKRYTDDDKIVLREKDFE